MAKGILKEPAYVEELSKALARRLRGAEINHEQVRDDRYRFIVVWDGFENKGHPERQRKVWNITDRLLRREKLLKVAMILTIAPSELPKD
jgi:hypothetical protein